MGKAIEYVTKSRAHHVVVGLDEHWCLSAEPGGARRRLISEYANVIWSDYNHDEYEANLIAGLAENSLGVRYNYAAFIILGISHATGWAIPQAVGDWLNARGETTCSQLARDIIRHVDHVPAASVPCPGDWLTHIEAKQLVPSAQPCG